MNLHQIVSGVIGRVNPFREVSITQSTGYTTLQDGTRVPTTVTLTGLAQIQDLSTDDLRLVEGLNLQGIHKVIYINGNWAGAVRASATGGDVFTFDGIDWLVTMVPEEWPDWTKVVVTMQSPKPGGTR
jgi:hypothetical protein